MKQPAVYIVTNKQNGTLYIGVTSDLHQRIYQHKNGLIDGFTHQYKCSKLVHYELYETMIDAIAREKQLKAKKRIHKIALIETTNKYWDDLSENF
ncbi:MAG: GIY-YIG nuclease family protein [Proteobacteria bacterium]|nr:GIY-YIG nuclease family protein [Pseudomonadota bacterium]NBP15446.1 GIY-YIG nuclease family protein [bacterium]